MDWFCSRELLKVDQMVLSPKSLATENCSVGGYSSQTGDGEQQVTRNIEEATSSLPDTHLNYEEARALLGRLEYQRGNIEAALHVFDGIDIAAIAPKMKISLSKRVECLKINSHSDTPHMSIHAVSLLVEAFYLKARALQDLGRLKEAAQSCNIILDTVEPVLPKGLPESFGTDCKLQEMLCSAVELLPELWKLAGVPHEAISSYRRALLSHWNLNAASVAKIQKEFAIYLLYGGCDASPPDLRSQIDGSFIPRNNIEEAILLFMILLRKFALKRIKLDPSIFDHLTFAFSLSGQLKALANQIEELLPGHLERKERYYVLALCYLGENDSFTSLNLLRKILSAREDSDCVKALLLASKVCGEISAYAEEGVSCARRALSNLDGQCDFMVTVANCLLGISLSTQARYSAAESERISRQSEALEAFQKSDKVMQGEDYRVVYNLSLEYAEQRKLDAALRYAKRLPKLEVGSNVNGWILLARILSAHKKFFDAETIINAALDQTGTWNQGELLRTKAKIQIAQGQLKNAIETYIKLLTVIQLRSKCFSVVMKHLKGSKYDRSLEIEIWNDLSSIYIDMSQWGDAEVCLHKLKAISPYSASTWLTTGKLLEAKGLHKEALGAYTKALDVDPTHAPSIVSIAILLRQFGDWSFGVVRSFLKHAVRLDRTNHMAWFNLGLLYKDEGGESAFEAVKCFHAAAMLEESAPVEPFR